MLDIYQVDAFAKEVFQGNPAAVIILEKWLDADKLQSIAAENNLSETAYLVQKEDDRFEIRWFTPNGEVSLCGHATLACAHVLFEVLNGSNDLLCFDSSSGQLEVHRKKGSTYQLNFPSLGSDTLDSPPSELLHCFSPEQVETCLKGQDMIIVLKQGDDVIAARPELSRWKNSGARGVVITSIGTDSDIVSRCFYPDWDVPEDPVTGSAHCQLLPYWSKRLGRTRLKAKQASRRAGWLDCELAAERVLITGSCALYMVGKIQI